uniref:Uncharacterized protein n=1 Tax=Arundo donax TaxID=35708 RepID=A0A0A9H7F9_ARUDO
MTLLVANHVNFLLLISVSLANLYCSVHTFVIPTLIRHLLFVLEL